MCSPVPSSATPPPTLPSPDGAGPGQCGATCACCRTQTDTPVTDVPVSKLPVGTDGSPGVDFKKPALDTAATDVEDAPPGRPRRLGGALDNVVEGSGRTQGYRELPPALRGADEIAPLGNTSTGATPASTYVSPGSQSTATASMSLPAVVRNALARVRPEELSALMTGRADQSPLGQEQSPSLVTAPTSQVGTTPVVDGASIQLLNPVQGDQALLDSVKQTMSSSSTATAVLAQLERGGAQVQFASAAELQQVSPNAQAVFSNTDNTIYLPRELAQQDPTPVAVMLAHEGTHWIHDPIVDQEKSRAAAVLQAQGAGAAAGRQLIFSASLATEVEAYMVEARAGKELGLTAPGPHPALRADGTFATGDETWAALAADPDYNPDKVSGQARWHNLVLGSG